MRSRRWLTLVSWGKLAFFLLASCANRGEPALCLDKRQEARNLALQDQIEEASRLLGEVKAQCGPNSASDIQHIGKLIEEKKQARRERERLELTRSETRQKFPSRDFVEWATVRDGTISGKVTEVTCAERGSEEFGFCEGRRGETPNMTLRYWQAEEDAYRYALVTNQAPSCQDLGEYRERRAWSREGVTYEFCELTNRRLRHLSALLVHAADGHRMYIFSRAYLARDTAFEQELRAIPPAR